MLHEDIQRAKEQGVTWINQQQKTSLLMSLRQLNPCKKLSISSAHLLLSLKWGLCNQSEVCTLSTASEISYIKLKKKKENKHKTIVHTPCHPKKKDMRNINPD